MRVVGGEEDIGEGRAVVLWQKVVQRVSRARPLMAEGSHRRGAYARC